MKPHRPVVSIRFSEQEIQLLDFAAQLQGQSRAELIREASKAKAVEAIHLYGLLNPVPLSKGGED